MTEKDLRTTFRSSDLRRFQLSREDYERKVRATFREFKGLKAQLNIRARVIHRALAEAGWLVSANQLRYLLQTPAGHQMLTYMSLVAAVTEVLRRDSLAFQDGNNEQVGLRNLYAKSLLMTYCLLGYSRWALEQNGMELRNLQAAQPQFGKFNLRTISTSDESITRTRVANSAPVLTALGDNQRLLEAQVATLESKIRVAESAFRLSVRTGRYPGPLMNLEARSYINLGPETALPASAEKASDRIF
jgi:hypothetical protein